jgi:hypothetical protein
VSHSGNYGSPDRAVSGLELEIEILLIMPRTSHSGSPFTFPLYYHHHLSPPLEYLLFRRPHCPTRRTRFPPGIREFAFCVRDVSISIVAVEYPRRLRVSLAARLCLVATISLSLSAIHAVHDFFCVALVSAVEWCNSFRFAAAVSACNMDSRPTSMRHGSPRFIPSSCGQFDRRP